MINPESNTDKMLFNTVRLETQVQSFDENGDPVIGSDGKPKFKRNFGTGFFFEFMIKNFPVRMIITNKHVVNYKERETVKFQLHEQKNGKPTGRILNLEYDTKWLFHPDDNIDLCMTSLEHIITSFNKEGVSIHYTPVQECYILDDEKLEDLCAIEDIIMTGYPIGLYDETHNLPLLRRGITSSHPALDFNAKSQGVIDCACFPGSSGSPIIIYNEIGYSDKKGKFYLGKKRFIFLGVLWGGPQFDAEGNLEIKNIPTQHTIVANTQVPMNLGYYVKAKEILAMKDIVKDLVAIPDEKNDS